MAILCALILYKRHGRWEEEDGCVGCMDSELCVFAVALYEITLTMFSWARLKTGSKRREMHLLKNWSTSFDMQHLLNHRAALLLVSFSRISVRFTAYSDGTWWRNRVISCLLGSSWLRCCSCSSSLTPSVLLILHHHRQVESRIATCVSRGAARHCGSVKSSHACRGRNHFVFHWGNG